MNRRSRRHHQPGAPRPATAEAADTGGGVVESTVAAAVATAEIQPENEARWSFEKSELEHGRGCNHRIMQREDCCRSPVGELLRRVVGAHGRGAHVSRRDIVGNQVRGIELPRAMVVWRATTRFVGMQRMVPETP